MAKKLHITLTKAQVRTIEEDAAAHAEEPSSPPEMRARWGSIAREAKKTLASRKRPDANTEESGS